MSRSFSFISRVLLLACFASYAPASWAQNYGQEINKQWQSILGIQKQEGPYQWFGYPVDNFGVITTYGPPSGRHLTDADRLCATWTCIGVDASKIPTDVVQYTTVEGYADSGQGPQIHLTNDKEGKATISLLLSNLLNALTLNGSVDLSKHVTVELTADGVYKRSVNVQKFQDYIKSKPDSIVSQVWSSGQLAYIGADIVAHNVKILLSIDVEKNASTNAQLTQAMSKLGSGSKAGATISSSGKGQYAIQYQGFVVLATQIRRQWKPGALFGSGDDVKAKQQEFVNATSSVPVPRIDPNTLRATK